VNTGMKPGTPMTFTRTTCACATCVQCCKDQPGSLVPGDLERIAAHLGEPVDAARRHFVASPGALVGDSQTGRVFRIGTITPAYEHGRCVFLDEHDRCRVHAVAPAGCAYFDTHQSREEGQRRGAWLVRQQLDPEYQRLRDSLPAAQHYKPRKA
jgi:Fe-S-cluster containining protein